MGIQSPPTCSAGCRGLVGYEFDGFFEQRIFPWYDGYRHVHSIAKVVSLHCMRLIGGDMSSVGSRARRYPKTREVV